MILKHVARVCTSEKKADNFYAKLLGLKKTKPQYVPTSLSKTIFNVDTELRIINYIGDDIHFEIFIDPHKISSTSRPVEHICLEIENRATFIKKCQALDINVTLVPRGNKTLTFITDEDNNLYEIKPKTMA